MKRGADGDMGSPLKRSKRAGDEEVRLLIPSKVAGSIIGKGGHNITKLRSQYKASITVPDCPGPERLLTLSSDMDSLCNIVNDVIPNLEEASTQTKLLKIKTIMTIYNGATAGNGNDIDMRMMVHQSQAGCIIGKGGSKIKEIREKIGTRIKIFSNPAPQSSDRVIQIIGEPAKCIDTLREVLTLIKQVSYSLIINSHKQKALSKVLLTLTTHITSMSSTPMSMADGVVNNKGAVGTEKVLTLEAAPEDVEDHQEEAAEQAVDGKPLSSIFYIYDGSRGGPGPRDGPRGGPGGAGGPGGPGLGGPRGGGIREPPFGGGSKPVNRFGGDSGPPNRGGASGGGFNNRNSFDRSGPNRDSGFTNRNSFGDNRSPFGGSQGGGSGNGAGFGGGRANNGVGGGGGFERNGWGGGGGGNNSFNNPPPSFSSPPPNASGPIGLGNASGPGGLTQTQVTIPTDLAGAIIGKGGGRIRKIRNESGAGITIDEPLPGSTDRIITISGTPNQIQMAQYLLQQSVHQNTDNRNF
ncbi:hypothetical protein D910_06020 [Dendroctonus ponderosae]|uniref:K Homology domain-containing protein n=1 Tax=Dendroctonus ponderosae TaxID=77166 RepID=U4UFE4_DENPD|nr:hypothetical protein D910_06020 [Dendroctonus ponderosae]